MNDALPLMADLNTQMLEELQEAQARIDLALALLDPVNIITYQTTIQLRQALVLALQPMLPVLPEAREPGGLCYERS